MMKVLKRNPVSLIIASVFAVLMMFCLFPSKAEARGGVSVSARASAPSVSARSSSSSTSVPRTQTRASTSSGVHTSSNNFWPLFLMSSSSSGSGDNKCKDKTQKSCVRK